MGADLKTLYFMWTGLYHDAGTIKDEDPRKRLRELLEKKLVEMNKIGDSGASQDSKLAQCRALEKELLEIQQEIANYPESQS